MTLNCCLIYGGPTSIFKHYTQHVIKSLSDFLRRKSGPMLSEYFTLQFYASQGNKKAYLLYILLCYILFGNTRSLRVQLGDFWTPFLHILSTSKLYWFCDVINPVLVDKISTTSIDLYHGKWYKPKQSIFIGIAHSNKYFWSASRLGFPVDLSEIEYSICVAVT